MSPLAKDTGHGLATLLRLLLLLLLLLVLVTEVRASNGAGLTDTQGGYQHSREQEPRQPHLDNP